MYNFIADNKEWIFDGIGVLAISSLISLVVYFVKKRKKDNQSQHQKSGKNSINLQSKGSISINGGIQNGTNSKDR